MTTHVEVSSALVQILLGYVQWKVHHTSWGIQRPFCARAGQQYRLVLRYVGAHWQRPFLICERLSAVGYIRKLARLNYFFPHPQKMLHRAEWTGARPTGLCLDLTRGNRPSRGAISSHESTNKLDMTGDIHNVRSICGWILAEGKKKTKGDYGYIDSPLAP